MNTAGPEGLGDTPTYLDHPFIGFFHTGEDE